MTKLFDAGIKERLHDRRRVVPDRPDAVALLRLSGGAARCGRESRVRFARSRVPNTLAVWPYFIWGTAPPDDALITAATNNELSDTAKRDAQVSRLMKDARFSRGVAQFYTRWLKLSAFREVARDVADFDQSVMNVPVCVAAHRRHRAIQVGQPEHQQLVFGRRLLF